MRYNKVCVEAFGYEIPDTVVTSQNLEERVAPVYEKLNLSYGRFELMTGIRERRFWADETSPSQASTKAAEKAIAKSGIEKTDIECLLHTSVCRDFLEPATATLVHDSLGLPPTATIFDISNACLGFTNGIITLANMIELGQVKAGIVVGMEGGKRLIDKTIDDLIKDQNITRDKLKVSFASLTLGSGSVAAVLTHSSLSKSGHESYPNMTTDYTKLLNNGVALAAEAWKAFQQEMEWVELDVNWFFTHQVSTVHQDTLFNALGLDKAKGFSTVEYLGNVASCSLPLSLAIGVEEGHVISGDKVVMMATGSGLCVIMLAVEW